MWTLSTFRIQPGFTGDGGGVCGDGGGGGGGECVVLAGPCTSYYITHWVNVDIVHIQGTVIYGID